MCNFIKNEIQCDNKKKYGNYCKKHKREHLIKNDMINFLHFTNNQKDYLRKDILNTVININHYNINLKKQTIKKLKKDELYSLLICDINKYKHYYQNEKLIHKIQNYYIHKKNKKESLLRGEGFLNPTLCNNEKDFYSFETYNELDKIYFFSYKDYQGFIWFFDIRSFDKLIQMKQSNPYNREKIPDNIIEKANKLIKQLKNEKKYITVDKFIIKSKKSQIKQKTIDIFSQMEQFGYSCNINWFLNLNRGNLKRLYKLLEDIWNYRLQLTNEMKSRIAPPNGLIFNIPIYEVNNMNIKEDLQDLLLNEISKFSNAISDDDKKLGFMYFIIGLGNVCVECFQIHEWLMYI
tara:strand:- start:14 stop:1060 length:1047 start_codon:yes stop_codon:yes gene_type:complete